MKATELVHQYHAKTITARELVEGVWMEPKYIFFGCEDSAAAAEFTHDRIEKIRQVKEEIQFAIMAKEKAELEDWHRGWMPVAERLIAARQAALAELCVGVKPEVLNGR